MKSLLFGTAGTAYTIGRQFFYHNIFKPTLTLRNSFLPPFVNRSIEIWQVRIINSSKTWKSFISHDFSPTSPFSIWGAMASAMVIKVRYFGTSKVKVAGRERYLKARIDENGQLGFDMGGLRDKICRICYLPPGSDITLVYIDEDGDVVTLVDDDDLQNAMRQRLKSFRIDVLMNDNKVYRKSSSDNKVRHKSSSKRSTRVMMDPVGSSLGTSDDNMETKKASTSSYATSDYGYTLGHSFHECSFIGDDPVNPHVACFKGNYLEAIGGMLLQTGVRCNGCGCNPLTGSRFKSIL